MLSSMLSAGVDSKQLLGQRDTTDLLESYAHPLFRDGQATPSTTAHQHQSPLVMSYDHPSLGKLHFTQKLVDYHTINI